MDGDTSQLDNARYIEAMEDLDDKYSIKDKEAYSSQKVDFNPHHPLNNKQNPFEELLDFGVINQVAKLKEKRLKAERRYEPNTSEDLADGETMR